ncbi:hypothetical protein ES703_96253 [subsurface metagenome]
MNGLDSTGMMCIKASVMSQRPLLKHLLTEKRLVYSSMLEWLRLDRKLLLTLQRWPPAQSMKLYSPGSSVRASMLKGDSGRSMGMVHMMAGRALQMGLTGLEPSQF